MTAIHSTDVQTVLKPLKKESFPADAFIRVPWEAYEKTYKECISFFEAVAAALPALGMQLTAIGFYPAQDKENYETVSMDFSLSFSSAEAFTEAKEKYGVDDKALFDTANHESLKVLNEAAKTAGLLGREKYELLDGAYQPYKWNTALRNKITVAVQ